MSQILFSWLSIPRTIGIWIDSIAYGLIDNIYNLIEVLASASLFEEGTVLTVMNNTYVALSIFALFRIALILVNAIINPDKLTDKENGIGSVLKNLIIMFVLLIFTPMLFREAYHLQNVIVSNHYIADIFSVNGVNNSDNPGKTMQRIAISALVHPDTDAIEDGETTPAIASYDSASGTYVAGSNCGNNCEEAIDDYNQYILDKQGTGENLWSTLTRHIGRTEKVNGDTVYVYTYMFFVTFIVGVFITYVLASMAIDIAVRSVELAVLQIISPLFIVTYIDPKSAKSGPFNNWLKTVGKTYASLFIKLAVLELMIMFIGLIDNITIFDKYSGLKVFGTLVVLLAILIFAKKAPKWIGDLIGVDGETSGIGGLGKKIGSAALVGGALTKAGHAAAGAARGAAGLVHKNAQDRRAQRKKIREDNNLTHGIKGRKTRQSYSGGYFNQRKQLHAARKAAYQQGGANLAGKGGFTNAIGKPLAAAATGAIIGGKVGLNASDLKGALKDSKGAIKNEASHLAFQKPETKFGNFMRDIPEKLEGTFGDPNELYQRRKDIEDAKNAKFHSGGRFAAGLGEGKIVEGNGDAVKLFKKYGAAAPGEDILAQYCETRGIIKPRGETSQEIDNNYREDFRKIAESAVKDSNGNISYSINNKTVSLSDLTRDLFVQGTGGVENLGKMFNSYQNNALSNFSHSQEQYMQQVSTYQSILNTQNATAQNAQAIAAALAMSLPDALKDVEIDASSMSGVKNAIKNLNDKFGMASEEEQKILNQKLQELSRLTLDYDESEKQLGVVKGSMDQLQETITKLDPIVKAIPGDTNTEREQSLAIASSKLDKVLEGIKKPSEEKK